MITERLNLNRPHVITDAERDLLKAAPEDAPALADAVVNEAEMGMAQFLEGHELGWTEEKALWIHLNNYMTPTSDTYIVIYKLMPSLFKLETLSMADPLVRKMPLSMLYCLLLDRKLPKAFRVQLAAEIR
uniref:Glycyl-tRNA synthetase beta subunit n=1 Tax=Panagrellus redivivus TaxID=6233 RepID=A0A7E4ZT08_PANRE